MTKAAHLKHCHELVLGKLHSLRIGRVNHVDDGVRVLVIAPPVRPDARLAAQVPHLEPEALVLHGLHVEACAIRFGPLGLHAVPALGTAAHRWSEPW